MPGRSYTAKTGYRYGFGGQERSDEIKGEGNSYTAEFWEYDPRVGRRWNIDPVFRAYESSYAAFGNNPILLVDPDGLAPVDPTKYTVQKGDNLTNIAKKFNTSVDNLVNWNKIKNRNVIAVDQVLTVSDPAVAAAQTKAEDLRKFGTYPNNGRSTGWTSRSSDHQNVFEITTASSGPGVLNASMQNYDVVYLQGGLLDKIKADPGMLEKENEIITEIKSNTEKYGKEAFYITGSKLVGFGGKRWSSSTESWSSINRNNPLLHKSTYEVGSNQLTWVLRNATVKYFAEVDARGSINIQYRLFDRLDLSPQNGRQEAYNNISKVLGFLYHGIAGGNSNLQTRAEWSTKK